MALPPPSAGTVVIVTGASAGIGAALARELAARGHGLVVVARRRERLQALAAELAPVPVDVEAVDLADEAARTALAARLLASDRAITGLCNAAGLAAGGRRFDALPLDREREIVKLNVEALHHLTGALLPALVERGAGSVLNLGSIAGAAPLPGLATYAATKAFVNSFSEALHAELRGTGVSVTSLQPGPTRTSLWDSADLEDVPRRARPFFMDTTPVARAAVDAMERGARTATPGLRNVAAVLGWRLMPRGALLPIAAWVNRRYAAARA